jgi:hypothetical protein
MGMRAVSDHYGFTEAIDLAVEAGVDLLLYTANLDSTGSSLARKIVDHLESRVNAGFLPVARVDEAFGRIMALKGRFLTGVRAEEERGIPSSFALGSYPNPFNTSTVIRFDLPRGGAVSVKVYDVLGRVVMESSGIALGPGRHEIRWDATGAATGAYFCRVEVEEGGRIEARMAKLMLIR